MRAATSIWQPPLGRLTLGLVLTVVATAFEALAVATILPTTTAELGGLEWYGWTFSAFMLANLVGITVGGNETDRRGPALPFIAGAALFAGGLVVSGVAPSMPVIVFGRTSQGFGGGLLSAVAYASIARAYAVDLQPRMLATLSSAWVIPGLVGPGLAGLVAEHLGWRWVFLGLAPLLAFAAVLVVPALRTERGDPDAPDGRARTWLAVQLAVGASIALTGLGRERPWLGLALVGGGSAARGAGTATSPPGRHARRAPRPARGRRHHGPPELRVLRHRGVRAARDRRRTRREHLADRALAHRRGAHVDRRRVDSGAARETRGTARRDRRRAPDPRRRHRRRHRAPVVARPAVERGRRVGRRGPRDGARVHDLLRRHPRVGAGGAGGRGLGVTAARAGARRRGRDRNRRRDRGGAVRGTPPRFGIMLADGVMLVVLVVATLAAANMSPARPQAAERDPASSRLLDVP